jgi:HK97 gp10 family phage protein
MAVDGVKELLKKFDRLNTAGKTKVLRAASRAAGATVAKDARSRIPVGSQAHRTLNYRKIGDRGKGLGAAGILVTPGHARRSIKVATYVNRSTGAVGAVVGVRSSAWYAVQFVELEKGKSTRRGRPWLRPAFDATRAKQISEFERRFRAVINKALKKQ